MAKNSIDAYGASGKSNVLFFDPESLVIVTDPKHPLYDERASLPVNEALVLNVMAFGILQAIVVWKDPESGSTIVVAGRQRVKAAREANCRLVAQGSPSIQVPGIPRRSDGTSLAGVMVSENELREQDGPMVRAKKMARLQSLGRSDDELAILFGCTKATVRNTLALLDAPAVVREAVEAGTVNVSQARELAKLAPDQQREKVAQLAAVASTATGREKTRRQRAIVGVEKPRMRSRAEIAAARNAADGDRRAALAWVLCEEAQS
jgi:ParB family chromosome partitioning protein